MPSVHGLPKAKLIGLVSGCSSLTGEVFGEKFFQSVQGHVRQRGRDDAALRRARLRWKQVSIFDVAGLQPFLKHHFVRGDVAEHPIVTDVVEAAFDVTFQHPLCRTPSVQCVEALLESVSGGAFGAKAVGIGITSRLRDGDRSVLSAPITSRTNPS